MLIDISPTIGPNLAVWPGDTPLSREVSLAVERGDPVTLSTIRATVHLGAHADAPGHYGLGAPMIDQADLSAYIGPCRVVRVSVGPGERVGFRHFEPAGANVERLLIATDSSPDPAVFREDFAALDPDWIQALADRRVRLIGIDTPSVDLFDSKDLPAHRACLRRGISILEGLVLKHVEEGEYELIALPLKLSGFDASPVRAVLRSLS